MKSTLGEVLQYRNDAIVHRFIETWEMSFEEASDVWEQTKKWLWLAAHLTESRSEIPDLAITQSTKLMDEMWHTFVLFTRDYHDFCERYFGFYLHHTPTPLEQYKIQIESYEKAPEKHMERMREHFRKQYTLVYDLLGEDTLLKWYSEYQERYTDAHLQRIWRWSFSPYDTRLREQVRLPVPPAIALPQPAAQAAPAPGAPTAPPAQAVA
jgi:hypothetical protein